MVFCKLLHQMMQRQRGFVFRTGDARTGEQVGVTSSVRGNLAQQIVIGIRWTDENRRDVVAHCRLTEWRRLFNGHVSHQHGVNAHAGALCVKRINTAAEHQIGVHQQADRNGRVLLTDRRQHFKALARRHARGKRA